MRHDAAYISIGRSAARLYHIGRSGGSAVVRLQELGRQKEEVLSGDGQRDRSLAFGCGRTALNIAGAYRVFYLAARAEAIYVLHGFEKKTQKTTAHDLRSVTSGFVHWQR